MREKLYSRIEEILNGPEGRKIVSMAAYQVLGEEIFPSGAPNPFYMDQSLPKAFRNACADALQRNFTHRKKEREEDEQMLRCLGERRDAISSWRYPVTILGKAQNILVRECLELKRQGSPFSDALIDWPERFTTLTHQLFVESLTRYKCPVLPCPTCFPPQACALYEETMKDLPRPDLRTSYMCRNLHAIGEPMVEAIALGPLSP
jgi:hypothetical protein